jgi:hypothetical protein
MDFYINKDATLPMVILELVQDGRNDYKKFHEKIQNANVTFSMYDVETGVKRIGCSDATCLCKTCGNGNDCDEEQYYISYQFKAKDTSKAGTFVGKFTIDFLDGSGTLIAPIREELFIHVLEGSIRK